MMLLRFSEEGRFSLFGCRDRRGGVSLSSDAPPPPNSSISCQPRNPSLLSSVPSSSSAPSLSLPSSSRPLDSRAEDELTYEFGLSKFGGEVLYVHTPDGCRVFCKSGASSISGISYYRCMSCRKHPSPSVATIRVDHGLPQSLDVEHDPRCTQRDEQEIACSQVDRKVREVVKWSGIPSSLAFTLTHGILKTTGGEQLASKFAPYHIYRHRLDSTKRGSLPAMQDEFNLPEELTMTVDMPGLEAPLLLCASKELGIYIFASKYDVQLAGSADLIVGDSTFDAAPNGWQLLTLHMRFWSEHHQDFEWSTFLHAVMRSKNEVSYKYVFSELSRQWDSLGLKHTRRYFRFDYERAQLNAAEDVFGKDCVGGCMFHYSQAVIKNLKQHGLFSLYKSCQEFHSYVRYLLAVPLLPPDLIVLAAREILDHPPQLADRELCDRVAKFLAYFHDQWLVKTELRHWCFWQWDVRTTNVAEGFHSRLQQHPLVKKHPNLIGLVSFIRIWQSEQSTRKAQLVRGDKPKPRNPTYERQNKHLMHVFAKFDHLISTEQISFQDIFNYLCECRVALPEFALNGVTLKSVRKRKIDANDGIDSEPKKGKVPCRKEIDSSAVVEPSVEPREDSEDDLILDPNSSPNYNFSPPDETEIMRIAQLLCVDMPENASENQSSSMFTQASRPRSTGFSDPDGACGFRTIAQCIFGPETDEPIHGALRSAICAFLESQISIQPLPMWVISHAPSQRDLATHVHLMKGNDYWMTDLEIQAAALLLDVNIFVFDPQYQTWTPYYRTTLSQYIPYDTHHT
uniref:MULE domain-containing protein n=1 Tax=Steinernema glaseri TaxID=37863 RepID=A0A1I7YUZ1_9BILA